MGNLRILEMLNIYNHYFKDLRVTTKIIEMQSITSKPAEGKN